MRRGERWHAPTARRLLVECIAALDEFGPRGPDISSAVGDLTIVGQPVPEHLRRWIRLRIAAHAAYTQACLSRRDSMPRLRRELDQVRAEAFLMFLSEAPDYELHLGVQAGDTGAPDRGAEGER